MQRGLQPTSSSRRISRGRADWSAREVVDLVEAPFVAEPAELLADSQPATGWRISFPVAAWMTGALVSFVIAAVSIRTLGVRLNVFEIGLVRLGGGLLVLLPLLYVRPSLRYLIVEADIPRHLPRNFAHAIGGMLWTLSIMLLPLATVFSLEFTAPAWAALLAVIILGERITGRGIVGILVSLFGVLVIIRPSPGSFDALALLPLGAAFCFALSFVLTRRLVLAGSTFVVLFWMMVIQFPINLVGALTFWPGPQSFVAPSGEMVAAGVALALSGLASQFCLTQALSHGEAGNVMQLDFLRVPLIAVLGWSLYGESIEVWVFLGFALIVAGVTYGLYAPRSKAHVMPTDATH